MIRSSLWSALENVALELLAFCVFLALARLLQPTDYGTVALAMVFVRLAGTIAGWRISTAAVQLRKLQPAHLDTAFWAFLA